MEQDSNINSMNDYADKKLKEVQKSLARDKNFISGLKQVIEIQKKIKSFPHDRYLTKIVSKYYRNSKRVGFRKI